MTEVAYQKALKVLEENKNSLTKLAQELLNKEVIFKEDLETIFGKRQWDKDEKVTFVNSDNIRCKNHNCRPCWRKAHN